MRRRDALPELLAPAGDFECLIAAVRAGADAVYIGAREFSARAFAKNFSLEEIDRASAYCHLHGVKLYVTVNVLQSTAEIKQSLELARVLYSFGVDALICADLGFIRAVRHAIPELEIHASTQMSVHNSLGASEAERLGCSRVVLARELSESDMRRTVENSPIPCEVFLHGALCVSHSGQCLFSSLVGGRSGNRGECAQPCRLGYNGTKYPLSLKDLSLAMHIPTLIDIGVASLKIEGRMKSPSYVYTVTRIYRTLLDECRTATDSEMEELRRVFSRSGFTDGYFSGKLGDMTGVRTESDIEKTRALASEEFSPDKVAVRAKATFKLGERASFTLTLGNKSVTAYSDAPEAAISSPLEKNELCERLSKMGNTYLSLFPSDVEITLDEGVNMPKGKINALRRLAVEMLEKYGRDGKYSEPIVYNEVVKPAKSSIGRTALFLNPEVLSDIKGLDYFDVVFVPLFRLGECKSLPGGVALPPVISESEVAEVQKMAENAAAQGVKYALVSNIGAIFLAKNAGLVPIGDFRLNVWNSFSLSALYGMGLSDIILSPELSYEVANALGGRAVVYGRIPLMLTERCFIKESFGCDKCNCASLKDRLGMSFPIMREWGHRNIILNSKVTYMADKLGNHRFSEHYIFSTERAGEINGVITSYVTNKKAPVNMQYRRMGKRDF